METRRLKESVVSGTWCSGNNGLSNDIQMMFETD